jgi:competence protein ComEC
MKRPLVLLVIIFCLGIFIANFIKISFGLIYPAALIFLFFGFLSLKKGLRFDILVSCLVLLLGIVSLKNAQILPRCHIARYVSYKNKHPYIIRGIINNQPILKNNKLSFILKTREIQFNNYKYKACGNILVYIRGRKDLNYAQELLLSGNLYRPFSNAGPNRRSYRDYLYNQGIFFIMHARMVSRTPGLNKNRGLIFRRLAFWLKDKMENIIFKRVSPLAASVLDAMILGEKRNIPALIYNSMIKSGTVHILVVSGFNVGIVSFIIILFLKLIRLARPLRIYAAIPLLILYCLVTGASNPVVRATVMAIVFMFAYFVRREPDIYNSCAVAMIFILVLNPRQLSDIGFQLSFASVISIVYLYPKIKSLLRIELLKTKYLKFLCDGCLVSFSAWLGTMGFIAYYFKVFSPITVLANIFIVPLATLITLCGLCLIVIELICPVLAPFFAYTNELSVLLLLKINAFFIKLPAAYFYLPR